MGNPRKKSANLPAKLLAIRKKLDVSQSQLAMVLELENGSPRISEYEIGRREPNLVTLLKYSKLARVPLEVLADDTRELKFRKSWKRPRRVNEMLMRDGLRRIDIKAKYMGQALSRRWQTSSGRKAKAPKF